MADTFLLKRSSTPGAVPQPVQLQLGEMAMNTADGKVYVKKSNGTVVQVGGGLQDGDQIDGGNF
jgi:hypothetical protein